MSFDDFKHSLKFEKVCELGHSSTYYKPSTVDSCISIYKISLEPFIVNTQISNTVPSWAEILNNEKYKSM